LNDDLDNLEQINSINNSINFINSNNSIKSINSINNSNYSEESNDVLENENINDSNFDINEIINIVNSPRSDNFIDDSSSFVSWLQEWVLRNRISHVALNELLKRIKPKYPALPLDARSLLKIPRKVNVQNVRPGQYYHFGLSNCIKQLLLRYSVKHLQCVKVNINIDGLPLFKSSSSQVYPILCNLVENYNEVNIVGIYYGNEKPADANVFLKVFTDEAIILTTHGITINDHTYPFKSNAFICDVPAKSFITFTKGHSGYYSCSKCTVKGEYIHNRIYYPYLNNFLLRTNNDFRLKLQRDHHTGTSILESIPTIDMVEDFPSDPMHLLYLGIVRKLIVNLWCFGTPRSKLSFNEMCEISKMLEIQKVNIPYEINRKTRSLFECKRWKATEFRTFLLYTGPVVLKSILNYNKYINFLTLHVAVTIFSNSKHISCYSDYAKSLLEYFVKTFIILYGKENASSNIHHLLHLYDDVIKFGTLQEFSAFPFENYLQSILKMIRKNDKILEQIVCRIREQNLCANDNKKLKIINNKLHNPHFNGPLINNLNSHLDFQTCKQFNKVMFQNYSLKTDEPDNCCSLTDGAIIKNFISNDKDIFVIGHKYKSLNDFYSEHCLSSKLGIYLVDNLGNLQIWNLKQIAYKCLKLKYKNQYVVFPLLHTN